MLSYTNIIIFSITLLYICTTVSCFPGPPLYTICNNEQIPNTVYETAISQVLGKVVEETPYKDFNYYTESAWSIVYGHAACNRKLKIVGCSSCLDSAGSQLLDLCPNSIGAQIQLRDCRVRYEVYAFSE